MRSLLAWSLTLVLVTIVSCGGKSKSKSESGSEPPARESIAVADAATTDLIATVGDGAALVFVFRDQGWIAVHKIVIAGFEGKIGGIWDRFAKTLDPVAGVWVLTEAMKLGLPKPTLEGRDPSRPIIVSAFESPYDGPPGAAIAMIANTDGRHPPSRYQLVIPAADVGALMTSLETWISAGGEAAPELVEGRAGGVGVRLGGVSNSESHVAILPGSGHVRVVLLHDSHGFGASDVRPWIDVTPAEVPDTPAYRHAAGEQPMAMLVRPWRLRAFGAWYGLEQAQQAVETVSMDQLNSARSRGTAIASSIALLTPDDNAEFDDWAFAASGADGTLSLTAVASLTTQGQQIWRAGTNAVERPFKLKRGVIADAFVSADVVAMLTAAGTHEAPEGPMSELIHTFRRCGVFCPTFFALRWPLAGFKTVSGANPPIRLATDATVLGAHFAWVEDGPSGPAWAAALIGGDERISTIGPLLQTMSGHTKLQTHETQRGDEVVVLLGAGVDPATVFDTDDPGPKSIDVARIGATQGALGLPTQLDGRVSMAGTALTAEVVFGPGELAFAPDFRELSWSSPMRSAPTSEAADCLLDAVRVVHEQIDAAATSSPGDAPKLYAAAHAAAAAPLRCAGTDPEVAAAARRLGDTIAILAARGHLLHTQVDEARAILTTQCGATGSKGPACDVATALGEVGTPTLVRRADAARCNPNPTWSMGSPMVVDGDQALFDGRTAKATPAGVSKMIIDAISMESRYEKSVSGVPLAISGDTPFGQALPVFLGIAALGGHPNPIVRGDGTDFIAIPIDYDLESTLIIDWKVAEGYRPPYTLEEEEPLPPQPEETPTEHRAFKEGTIGGPPARAKTGLYVMKGPKGVRRVGGPIGPGSAVLAVELTSSELAVVLPDGKRTLVRDPATISKMTNQVRRLLGREPELVVTLTVAPDVPWSRYVDLLVATCSEPLILVNP